MRIAILTNEYPPNVYGGAGVHVEYLTRELARLDGGRHHVRRAVLRRSDREESPTLHVEGIPAPAAIPAQDPRHVKLFDTMLRDLIMSGRLSGIDVVHCHTWYTHLAGCVAK